MSEDKGEAPRIRIGVEQGDQRAHYDEPDGWGAAKVISALQEQRFESVGIHKRFDEPRVSARNAWVP